jgi:hypothetical protein
VVVLMRTLMGLIKDRHGTYYAQKRVPENLQEAVAKVLKSARSRQVFLKKSLGTKTLKEANTRAKPVLMEFDRTLERAEALLVAKPVRRNLSNTEIKRMREHYFATVLSEDEQVGPSPLAEEGREVVERFELGAQSHDDVAIGEILELAQDALRTHDWSHVKDEVGDLLETFGIRLDETSDDYRKLSQAILREHVRAYQAVRQRSQGHPVETPPLFDIAVGTTECGGSLREPYLEIHHIPALGEGGADHPLNVAAVCPNCHQRVTHGSDASEHNAVIEQNVKAAEAALESQL